jgi:hypothetical protein
METKQIILLLRNKLENALAEKDESTVNLIYHACELIVDVVETDMRTKECEDTCPND